MKRPLLTLSLLLCASVGFGEAEQGSGSELLSRCKAAVRLMDNKSYQDTCDADYCTGFVVSASAGYLYIRALGDRFNGRAQRKCIPDGVTTGQEVRVFVKWLEAHPEKLHDEAFFLFLDAMKDAFPCENQPQTSEPPPTPTPRK
jgi:hypothetical protein